MFISNVVLPLCCMLGSVYGDQIIDESGIMDWEAPEYLRTKFPYYLSGYDYDGSPVFVFEAGKWDMRSAVDAGPEAKEELDNWITQIMLRMRSAGNEALGSPGAVVILDVEGLGIAQLGHVGVLEILLKTFPKFQQVAQLPGFKKVYIINAHYLYKLVYELGKPMLGEAANLIALYGTIAAKWKPVLLKDIPAEELPAWPCDAVVRREASDANMKKAANGNCRTTLENLLRECVGLTDHEDVWSMITLHRELTNACTAHETCSHKSELVSKLKTIVDCYKRSKLDSSRK